MAGVREKLLTASDLATLCEVDLKTIHNWVDRGRIAHFRTPGRHLRFRAADVADFLRAWGYSVPRELARASSRTMLVVGPKETVALVTRALGEASAPAPGAPPSKPAAQAGEQSAPKAPIRQVAHPYDALVYAGSDPADVYIVDVRAVAADIDVTAMLEALHRASAQGMFVALADEPGTLPAFVTRVARGDAAALRVALGSENAAPPAATGAAPSRPASSSSPGAKVSSAAIPSAPSGERDVDEAEDEAPPRGVAVGSSR